MFRKLAVLGTSMMLFAAILLPASSANAVSPISPTENSAPSMSTNKVTEIFAKHLYIPVNYQYTHVIYASQIGKHLVIHWPFKQPSDKQSPVEQPSVEQPPVEQPSEQQPNAEQPPAKQSPAEQSPVKQPPAKQPPVEQSPVKQPPAKQPPVSQPPAKQPPVATPPANPGQGINHQMPASLTADERQMVQLIHQERQKAGLKPLEVDMELVKVARAKAQDMIEQGYFSHTSPTYGSPFDMMRSFGVTDWQAAAENIAQNPSVTGAHESFMNSPGHRNNIMNPSFHKVGVGILDGGPYGKTFVQLFTQSY